MLGVGTEGQLVKDMKLLKKRSLEIVQDIKKQFEETGDGNDFLSLFLKKGKEEDEEKEELEEERSLHASKRQGALCGGDIVNARMFIVVMLSVSTVFL
jgi:hypothetical protein